MNNYDKLLISYTDVHSYKEYAHEPFLQGEFAYATNGQSCIQVRKDLPKKPLEERDNPNTLRIFTKERNKDRIISYDMLKRAMQSIPKVNFERCPACDGEGKVEFEFEFSCKTYTTKDECPVCGGSGERYVHTPIPDYRYGVCLLSGGMPVKQTYIEQLGWCIKLLEVESVRLVSYDGFIYRFDVADGVQVAICAYQPGTFDGELSVNV